MSRRASRRGLDAFAELDIVELYRQSANAPAMNPLLTQDGNSVADALAGVVLQGPPATGDEMTRSDPRAGRLSESRPLSGPPPQRARIEVTS